MATIFTEIFAYSDIDIEIGDQLIGYKGRELIFSKNESDEIRVTLSDEQLQELADVLQIKGFCQAA